MATTRFEDLVNGMINVGFGMAATAVGVTATAAEKGKEVLDDLASKGEEARHDPSTPDFARSMSDIFERAGGVFTETTERLSTQGETVAERVLDELILARARQLSAHEREAFVKHVSDLVATVRDEPVSVPVESVEDAPTDAAPEDTASAAGTADGAQTEA